MSKINNHVATLILFCTFWIIIVVGAINILKLHNFINTTAHRTDNITYNIDKIEHKDSLINAYNIYYQNTENLIDVIYLNGLISLDFIDENDSVFSDYSESLYNLNILIKKF